MRVLVKLAVSQSTYDEIKRALIEGGAPELILERDRPGEALNMEDIALVLRGPENARPVIGEFGVGGFRDDLP